MDESNVNESDKEKGDEVKRERPEEEDDDEFNIDVEYGRENRGDDYDDDGDMEYSQALVALPPRMNAYEDSHLEVSSSPAFYQLDQVWHRSCIVKCGLLKFDFQNFREINIGVILLEIL